MKPHIRYGIIALSIIVFLILAPALVLYISGRKVNISDRDTGLTGILDAKSNPTGAAVTLDGKDNTTTPAIVRFLNQGEYSVLIHQDGYFDWKKKLPIEQGKVTYAQVGVDQVQLLKLPNPQTLVLNGVSNFVVVNDDVWYVETNGDKIYKIPAGDPQNRVTISLPSMRNTPILTVLRDKKHIYLGSGYILNTDDNSLVSDPNITSGVNPNNIVVTTNGIILSVSAAGVLNSYDPSTKKTATLSLTLPPNGRANSIKAITMIDNTGYFIVSDQSRSETASAVWNGQEFTDGQSLSEYIGSQEVSTLYITDSKKLFWNSGNTLYRVNGKLEKLSDNVLNAQLDFSTDEFEFQNASELWFYNFITNRPQLLSRETVTQSTPYLIRSDVGYGFVGNSNGLDAIEIDNRDIQNRYQLLKDKKVWQISMSSNQKTIYALQDGALIKLEVRN